MRRGVVVSIPIGFSHQLRQIPSKRGTTAFARFNPYRVFSSAETKMIEIQSDDQEVFQSLSGFLIS
mgnify:CR=1 FL=1